jgi:hypothetical protein
MNKPPVHHGATQQQAEPAGWFFSTEVTMRNVVHGVVTTLVAAIVAAWGVAAEIEAKLGELVVK